MINVKQMFREIFAEKALREYEEIFAYISEDNLFYANKVLNSIDETIDTILEFPYIWKQLNKIHRIIIEPQYKYKIVYRIDEDIIYIVSIFKYKNDWE